MKKSKKNSSTDSKKYVFVQANNKDFTAIKLTKGKWKNVILKYGKVAFAKDERNMQIISIQNVDLKLIFFILILLVIMLKKKFNIINY